MSAPVVALVVALVASLALAAALARRPPPRAATSVPAISAVPAVAPVGAVAQPGTPVADARFDSVFSPAEHAELAAAFARTASERDPALRWRTTESVTTLARRRTRLAAARPARPRTRSLAFCDGTVVALEGARRPGRLAAALEHGPVSLVSLRCSPHRWELGFDTALGALAVRCSRLDVSS